MSDKLREGELIQYRIFDGGPIKHGVFLRVIEEEDRGPSLAIVTDKEPCRSDFSRTIALSNITRRICENVPS
jgi:hypothetical protein